MFVFNIVYYYYFVFKVAEQLKIKFNLDASAQGFRDILLEKFPFLRGREYELCRAGRYKKLVVLAQHVNTPRAIKGAPNPRSCLYIRPLVCIVIFSLEINVVL